MELVKQLLPLAVQGSLLLMVVSLGLRTKPSALTYMFQHPRGLFKGLVAIDLVVPVVSIILIALLPMPNSAKLAISLMAISPMAPLFPGKALKAGGRTDYVASLYFVIVLLAVVTVPLWIEIQSRLFNTGVHLSPLPVARLVLLTALLPLLAGLVIGHFVPASRKLAGPINVAGNIVLAVFVVLVLIKLGAAMLALVGNGTVLAIAVTVLAALAAGHLLGGPDERDRATLAAAASTRHPGIAALIANESFVHAHAQLGILLFMLAGLVVAIPYNV